MAEIILENVSKHFEDKKVIDNLSLRIELNPITSIMGESGCGKTTLLRLLTGLEKADNGQITGIPQKVSYMFQEDRLLDWLSAYENIKLVSDEQRAGKYLEKVYLDDEKDTLIPKLSGGMKRRVALARALAYESNLVILDEPFKGMDYELKKKMIELVIDESKTRPFIVVVHEKEEAELLSGSVLKLTGIPLSV